MNEKSEYTNNIIELQNVNKIYRVPSKSKGLKSSIKSFVKKKYRETNALKNVNIVVKEGDIIGVIGANGAGKTTLIKVITGLLYPEQGSIVKVFGENPFKKEDKYLSKISFVSGIKNQLNWDLTAMDSFLLNKAIYSVEDEKFDYVVKDLSERLNVIDFLDVPVRNVSLGQRMKLELICALIHSPELVFLDEPTIGLDYDSQNSIREFLKEYNKKNNATIMITSHNLEDIKKLCNRIAYIDKGNIKYLGSTQFLEEKKISDCKIIEITCYNTNDINGIFKKNYGNVMRRSDFKISISSEIKEIPNILSNLFDSFDIQDINILESDIQYLIEEVYYKVVAVEEEKNGCI